MTVCIGTICDGGVLAIFDSMFSMSFVQGEYMGLKANFLKGGWISMLAANDVTDAEPIMDRVDAQVSKESDIQEIEKAFRESYLDERQRRANTQILGVYGLTMDRFLKSRRDLGDQVFYDLFRKIDRLELDCEFLVVGFQPDKTPHILHIDGSGRVRRYSRMGFAAIGSGAPLATSTLYQYGYNEVTPFNRAVYLISQAKFTAESAPGVGRDSYLFSRKPGEGWKILRSEGFERIREVWRTAGKPRVPDGIENEIAGFTWGAD